MTIGSEELQDRKRVLMNSMKARKVLTTPEVIAAFEEVPREKFIAEKDYHAAYADEPLSIGYKATISQPTTVAIMTEALEVEPGQKILEIGTGSGYQAAILSKLVGSEGKIYTIEYDLQLYHSSKSHLTEYSNVYVIHGDGGNGYPREAPFDRIIGTATAQSIPSPLFEQLAEGGILVAPVGRVMYKIRKKDGKFVQDPDLGIFDFVPLKGKHGSD